MTVERSALINQLDILNRNTDIPFTASCTWSLTEADKDAFFGLTFGWLQAFFDNALGVNPQLVVFAGKYNEDGSKQGNIVPFAFSGEKVKIKGNGILSTGKDCRGVTWTSVPIGETGTTDLLRVIAWGGNS
jgi:hypothetical protein